MRFGGRRIIGVGLPEAEIIWLQVRLTCSEVGFFASQIGLFIWIGFCWFKRTDLITVWYFFISNGLISFQKDRDLIQMGWADFKWAEKLTSKPSGDTIALRWFQTGWEAYKWADSLDKFTEMDFNWAGKPTNGLGSATNALRWFQMDWEASKRLGLDFR